MQNMVIICFVPSYLINVGKNEKKKSMQVITMV